MTVPEENAPKTDQNDHLLRRTAAPVEPDDQGRRPRDTEMGARLKEAMSEADVDRDDFA